MTVLLLGAVCFAPSAAAPPAEVKQYLAQSGLDAADPGSWSLAGLWGKMTEMAADSLAEPLRFAAQSGGYLLLAAAVSAVTAGSWKPCVGTVSVLGFGVISLGAMMRLLGELQATAEACQTYLTGFVPVYTGILALGGQTAGAAVYSGMFLAMSAFLSGAIRIVVLPVMQIYFCFAVSASLWGNKGITRAARLFGRLVSWLLKGCGLLFSLVLGLQSVLAGNADTAALRLGKSLLAGAVPLVGDAAAAALSSAAAALHLLKGSLALAAILAAAATFGPVFLRCALYHLAFLCAGMVAEAGGQRASGDICSLFAQGTALCGSVLVLYFFMVFFSTVLLLVTGNGG